MKSWMMLRRGVAAVLGFSLAFLLIGCGEDEPSPGLSQVVNPIVTVGSVQEMEEYLGYEIPVLEKEVEFYIVLVIDGVAESGRIRYADGTDFNIKRGTGDVSGIYGGILEREETIEGVPVSFYSFEDFRYAIWEQDGFACSLTGDVALMEEVTALIS